MAKRPSASLRAFPVLFSLSNFCCHNYIVVIDPFPALDYLLSVLEGLIAPEFFNDLLIENK